MLNQLVLVGRITKIKEEGKKGIVTIATPQNFKNANGEYDTNYFDCLLFGSIADNVKEWCEKGDLIGIKGRVQRIDTTKPVQIIAERVTFLSSKKGE